MDFDSRPFFRLKMKCALRARKRVKSEYPRDQTGVVHAMTKMSVELTQLVARFKYAAADTAIGSNGHGH